MADLAIGAFYADRRSPGRVVKILAQRGPDHLLIETVAPSQHASSSRAVGKQTTVTRKTFARFKYLGADQCTFCGYTTHRQPDGTWHCPITD